MEESCDKPINGSCDKTEESCEKMEKSYEKTEKSCDKTEKSCDKTEESCDKTEESCDKTEESCDKTEESCDKMEESCDKLTSDKTEDTQNSDEVKPPTATIGVGTITRHYTSHTHTPHTHTHTRTPPQPPLRCTDCRQFLDDQSIGVFIGDPENAVRISVLVLREGEREYTVHTIQGKFIHFGYF